MGTLLKFADKDTPTVAPAASSISTTGGFRFGKVLLLITQPCLAQTPLMSVNVLLVAPLGGAAVHKT